MILYTIFFRGYIGCTDDDAFYDIWKLDIHGYTRINLEKPELFEIQENNLFLCDKYKRNDGRDKWLVVEHSKKLNMKYIIENKQTGAVLEQGVNNNYLAEWDNTDSQLWILEPQNRGGYFKIRNAESGCVLYFTFFEANS